MDWKEHALFIRKKIARTNNGLARAKRIIPKHKKDDIQFFIQVPP